MTVKKAIEYYRDYRHLPRECHLNWLKDNFNPILKGIDPKLFIVWSCSNCVMNYMNMLVGWLEKEELKEVEKKTTVIKKKKSAAKKRTRKPKKKS